MKFYHFNFNTKNRINFLKVFIKPWFISIMFLFVAINSSAQVGIGTESPNAWLDVNATDQGILFSRVVLTARNVAAPIINPQGGNLPESTIVYNTATDGTSPYEVTPGFYYWNGTEWVRILNNYDITNGGGTSPTGDFWSLTGNTITDAQFLGTLNHKPLIIKTNNTTMGTISPLGGVSFGIDAVGSANHAFAFGHGAKAAETDAYAIGTGAWAADKKSFAIGTDAKTEGQNSFAMGNLAKTSNNASNSVAIGQAAFTSGEYSIAIGQNASTIQNAANAVAIGFNSKANANDSYAFGASAEATGDSSLALGTSTKSTSNRTLAIGSSALASGTGATAIGYDSSSSGTHSTALGYKASTTQDFSIVLGDSSDEKSKVGIGTSAPASKLHIFVPSTSSSAGFQLQDNNEADGKVLTSDANGKATWKDMNDRQVIGQLVKSSNTTLSSGGSVPIGTADITINCNANGSTLQVKKDGLYKVAYNINIRNNSTNTVEGYFYLKVNGTAIPSQSHYSVGPNSSEHITFIKFVNLIAWQGVDLHSSVTNSNVDIIANGTNLSIEWIQ